MKAIILHIVSQMKIGGLEKGIKNIVTQLTDFQHVILVLETLDLKWVVDLPSTVLVIVLNRKPGPLLWSYPRIIYWIKTLQPDLIHTRNLSTLECQLLAKYCRVKHGIHSEHGRDSSDLFGRCKKRQRWRKFFRPFVDQYFTVSEELSDYLQKQIKVNAKKITVIPNGVALVSNDQKLKTDGPLRIGMVMRLVDNKKPLHCLAALAQLRHIPIQCDIVGSGPEMPKVKQAIEDFCLHDQVNLLDKQYHLQNLYQQWDIVVLPSQFEGCSNVVLEAMAAGLVVIASEIPGNQAIIQSGENGLLYPFGQVDALQACLLTALSSEKTRLFLGQSAQKTIEKNFTLSVMLKNYERCYKELLCAG